MFGNDPRLALPISEIVFRPGLAHPIVSYDGKWLPESPEFRRTEPVCPAVLESDVERTVRDAAVRACALLGCRDYARVDIRLRDGLPQILEINANPDISPDAGLARSAAAAGMDYPQLVGRVLDMARGRKEAVDA